jgi:hypothetical protein
VVNASANARFDHTPGGGHDGGVPVLTQCTFHIAREPLTMDTLHRVIEVTAVVKLLGMTHQNILHEIRCCNTLVLQDVPIFFQFREMIRTPPRIPYVHHPFSLAGAI